VFTGIVEGLGSVIRLARRGGAIRVEVQAPREIAASLKIGDSISVNGTCVTVTEIADDVFAADLVPETLGRTNLGTLQGGDEVNLERPLSANGRLDGHIVQGHIDVVGLVRSRRKVGAQELLEINVPFELTRYLAPKGSVSVDGVSLTVVDVNKDRFRVALIPHTIATTTLGKKVQGQAVNVEVDVLSKYVERHIAARMPQRQPSIATLVAQQDAEMRSASPPPQPAAQHGSQAPRPAAVASAARPQPTAPRSQPAPRPSPPPRQQPPRFTAPVMRKPSRPAAKAVASKSPNRHGSKPAPKKKTSAAAKPKPSARSAARKPAARTNKKPVAKKKRR
jgi:riboflavin synthase